MNDFDAIAPPTKSITVGGRTVVISPIKVGKVPVLIRTLGPLVKQYGTMPDEQFILSMMGENGEQLLESVSIMSGLPRTEIDELQIDDAVGLAAVCIEVNRDFFTKRVIPRLNELTGSMESRLPS